MFHIPTLKSAMAEVGLTVTEGETMNAKDLNAWYDFAYRHFGLTKNQAGYGLAYPSTITSAIPGHPGNEATPELTVEAVEALMPPVVFPPPTPKPVIPNINDMANPLETEENPTSEEIVDIQGEAQEHQETAVTE